MSVPSPTGLYIHIPFCLKKCHYCDFVITTKRDPLTRETFFNALTQEMEFCVKKYGRLKFNTLYLGGGTPSALEVHEFERLHQLLHSYFDFEEGYEFSVEVNPGDVDFKKVKAYSDKGVNRISLGVQAVQEHLLLDMNRPHGYVEIQKTVEMLQISEINNLSMDVILNLPHQSISDVDETLDKLLKFNPSQISVYDLDVHEKTVYGKRQQEGNLKLSDDKQHAAMTSLVSQKLQAFGMEHYELSNFAKPGYESQHNLIYWNNQSYLGLGPGAFSYMKGIRYQMARSVSSYFQKATQGDWTPEEQDELTAEEIEKEDFLTGIRLKAGIDLRRLNLLSEKIQKTAVPFLEEGMLEKDGFRLKFTDKGKPLAEWMLKRFARV